MLFYSSHSLDALQNNSRLVSTSRGAPLSRYNTEKRAVMFQYAQNKATHNYRASCNKTITTTNFPAGKIRLKTIKLNRKSLKLKRNSIKWNRVF